MAEKFQSALKDSLRPPKVKATKRRPDRPKVWWGPTHLLAILVLIAATIGGVYATQQWLDGRTLNQGLTEAMNDSEVKHGDNAESDTDVGVPPPVYRTCDALREVYPAGVSKFSQPRIYEANRVLDVDRDRVACEDGQKQ